MIDQTLSNIEEVISMIKNTEHSKSYFSKETLFQFEFIFMLCMDITRFELLTSGEISDLTADAASYLFTFSAFEFYYRDYPEIYKKCSQLSGALSNFNEKWRSHDTLGIVGTENCSWNDYFADRIAFLLKP